MRGCGGSGDADGVLVRHFLLTPFEGTLGTQAGGGHDLPGAVSARGRLTRVCRIYACVCQAGLSLSVQIQIFIPPLLDPLRP